MTDQEGAGRVSRTNVWDLPDEIRPLVMRAFDALVDTWEGAPIPDSGERRWFVSDHHALLSSMGFEDRVRSKGLPLEMPTDVRSEMTDYIDYWHAALPFNEAERGIVCSAYRAGSGEVGAYREIPSQIRRQEFEIVNAGLGNVVKGRDLMRRWWAWRREADEFDGHNSLIRAKTALIQMVGLFVSSECMPPHISRDIHSQEQWAPVRRTWPICD